MLNGIHELEKSLEISDIPPRKEHLQNSDVIFFHNALACQSLDEGLDKPSVLMNHGGCREHAQMFEEHLQETDPTKAWSIKKDIEEIRERIAEVMSKPDVVLSNSHYIKRQLQEFYGVDSEVVYPPINRERFQPTDDQGDYFVSVQRMDWTKRVDAQIEAFSQLDEELKIIGKGTYDDMIRKEAAKHDNIEYLGYVSDEELVRHYSAAKAVIQTAIKEDYGLVPREGMACGTPAIVGNEGGFMEMIPSREYGIKFDPTDRVTGLRDAVREFNRHDYDSEKIRAETEKYGYNVIREQLKNKIKKAVKIHGK